MRRTLGRVMIAAALIGLGWTVGQAQSPQPSFEVVVTAPTGQTVVECRRGCELAWVERGVNPNATPQKTFTYSCNSPSGCSSGRIGGWAR